MTKEKKRTVRQSKSIAKRLNSALVRRRFVKTLILDVFICLFLVAMWCGVAESFLGDGFSLFTERRLTNLRESTVDNVTELLSGNYYVAVHEKTTSADGEISTVSEERRLPFSGVYYIFKNDGVSDGTASTVTVSYGSNSFSYVTPEEVAVDASLMLTIAVASFFGVFILQALYFILVQFTGRGLIRKYLRPIDDMAIAAERLSQTLHSANGADGKRKAYTGIRLDDIESEEIAQAIDAIDAIDEPKSRIDIPETELGGLEDAINNMLRRLDETQKHQIRFVDDASHELRTPIAVIQGYANMLDRWGKNDPQIMEEAIEAIKTESEHMKTLIDQLLFLARGEMDRHVMDMAKIDAAELIDEIYDESVMLDKDHEYSIYGGIRSVAMEGETEGTECKKAMLILADTAMIKQAIRILRDNAVKYTPAGGAINFKVCERAAVTTSGGGTSRAVCIEVSDNGMGINPDELSRVFDRFYRGSNVRSSSASGSGLGLSIAKWIVEEHGGIIEAISSPGFGTKMSIVLPAVEADKE